MINTNSISIKHSVEHALSRSRRVTCKDSILYIMPQLAQAFDFETSG